MFQSWRIKLREVDEALKGGRLDDASRLLLEGDLRQYYPAQRLIADLSARLIERGRTRAQKRESSAGWRDLAAAEKLGADAGAATSLRQQLVQAAITEAEQFLAAGSCEACLASLENLEQHGGAGQESRQFKQAVRRFDEARKLARRGKFPEAQESLAVAATLRPDLDCISHAARECREKAQQCSLLQEELHKQLAAENWPEVLHTADQMLVRAPDWRVALDARQKAWAHVGMRVTGAGVPARAVGFAMPASPRKAGMRNPMSDEAVRSSPPGVPGPRFLLWIDGVGGYLVCEGDEIVVGQPTPGGQVDVPILGDISRQHARIHRNGEGYLLQPLRPTRVAGRPVEGWHSLVDGQVLELGEGVQLRFRRPNALSTTARLEFASHHRTQPAADAVVLMSESCVLGPAASCHIVCRGWSRQMVVFRQDGDLWIRTAGKFTIDGRPCEGEGRITRSSQIIGDGFSMSLEEIGH